MNQHNSSANINNPMSNPASGAVAGNAPDVYAAPTTDSLNNITMQPQQYNDSTWYSTSGRIGRVQLLAYTFIWSLVIIPVAIVVGVVGAILGAVGLGFIAPILIVIFAIVPVVFTYFILPKRRLEDLGRPWWWLLSIFIPVVGLLVWLYYIFAPGDEGVNEYGYPPPPYTKLQLVFALVLPVILIISVALSLIFYNKYADSYYTVEETSIDDNIETMIAEIEAQNAAGGDFESSEDGAVTVNEDGEVIFTSSSTASAEGTVEWTDEEQARFDSIDERLEQMQTDMESDDYWDDAQGSGSNPVSQQNSNDESSAQIQAAIDEAVGTNSGSGSSDMSLEEFIQSEHTIYVDKTPTE